MRLRGLLVLACFLLVPATAFAQGYNWEASVGMQYARFHPMAFDEPIEPFVNAPAWDVSFGRSFSNWLGVKADVSRAAMYDSEGDPPDHSPVSLLTYGFGPVFSKRLGDAGANSAPELRHQKTLFAEVLLGGYRQATKYTVMTRQPITGVALMAGGGMDVRLNRRISIRAFDLDWLSFLTDNAVYVTPVPAPKWNLRLSGGLAFRL